MAIMLFSERDTHLGMDGKLGRKFATFGLVIAIIALLAWLTTPDEDPCANPQVDISASVLADSEDDQDGLINRAIIMKANCDEQ